MTPIQALEQVRELVHTSMALVDTPTRRDILVAIAAGLSAPDAAPAPLSLAQQHADELRDCLNLYFDADEASANVYQEHRDRTIAVLAKTRPPLPPTLEEALDIIGRIGQNLDEITMPGTIRKDLRKLLDRVPK